MYERFTDRARKAIQLANQEALRFNHEYIGTEHILLGLVKEGEGVAAHVLINLGIKLRTVRMEVEKQVACGPEHVLAVKLPQTPRAKKAIEFAMEASKQLEHKHVGTAHVLLGVLQEQEGVASQVLVSLGVTLDQARAEVKRLYGAYADLEKLERGGGAFKPPIYYGYYERFTDEARKVLEFAHEEALARNHECVGSEHLLLGLCRDVSGSAVEVLNSLGIQTDAIQREIDNRVPMGTEIVSMGKLPQTPVAKRAIEYAMEETRKLNQNRVDAGHILLGLLRVKEGIAAQVLTDLDDTLEKARVAVIRATGPATSGD